MQRAGFDRRTLETQILSQQRDHQAQRDKGHRTMVLLQRGDDVATSGYEVNRPENTADNTDAAGSAQKRTSRLFGGDSRRTKRAPIFVALARTRFPLILMLLWIRGGFGHAQTLHDFLRKFNYQLSGLNKNSDLGYTDKHRPVNLDFSYTCNGKLLPFHGCD